MLLSLDYYLEYCKTVHELLDLTEIICHIIFNYIVIEVYLTKAIVDFK